MTTVIDRILPGSPASSLPDAALGWQAKLDLGFARRGDGTVLVRNRHLGPLRVQKPLHPEGKQICHAIMLHPPAGLVGGDALSIDVMVESGAHALLTTPGAGKWYRSDGRVASLGQRIEVAEGGVCEWLPQESIVFEGARGRLCTEVVLWRGARFIGTEMLCLGRTGSGERFRHGALAMSTRVTCAGAPMWLERARIEGGGALLDSPAGLAGQPVVGSLLAVGAGVDEVLRDACREIPLPVGDGAVTLLTGVLVARWVGPAVEPGRAWFEQLWAVIRPALIGEPMRVPRIWRT